MAPVGAVRVDKWLWAVRLFKTRTAATTACERGHVRMSGEPVKPARRVTAGDEIELRDHPRVQTCRVEDAIEKRVGAAVADACISVLVETPSTTTDPDGPWWETDHTAGRRERGAGRPTKRERRDLDRFQGR